MRGTCIRRSDFRTDRLPTFHHAERCARSSMGTTRSGVERIRIPAHLVEPDGYVRLVEQPITTVEQITDDVLDHLAGAMPVHPERVKDWSVGKDTGRPPRFLTEELLQKWRKEDVPDPSERRDELLDRRDR